MCNTLLECNQYVRCAGPDLRGGAGPRLPTNREPPTKPFMFFSFVICVCVTLGFYSLPLSDPQVSWAPSPPPAKSGPGDVY